MQSDLEQVLSQAARLLPAMRWVQATSIHLTMAFLGELDDTRLEAASQATRQIALTAQPFSYSLNGLGVFGSVAHPRVVWVGISDPEGFLGRLQHALYVQLTASGFTLDERPFVPHLTLARARTPLRSPEQQQLQRLLSSDHFVKNTSYPASALHVMKSDLSATGAHYTSLSTFPFADVRPE